MLPLLFFNSGVFITSEICSHANFGRFLGRLDTEVGEIHRFISVVRYKRPWCICSGKMRIHIYNLEVNLWRIACSLVNSTVKSVICKSIPCLMVFLRSPACSVGGKPERERCTNQICGNIWAFCNKEVKTHVTFAPQLSNMPELVVKYTLQKFNWVRAALTGRQQQFHFCIYIFKMLLDFLVKGNYNNLSSLSSQLSSLADYQQYHWKWLLCLYILN